MFIVKYYEFRFMLSVIPLLLLVGCLKTKQVPKRYSVKPSNYKSIELIEWKPERKLSWKDFKGGEPSGKHDRLAAITYTATTFPYIEEKSLYCISVFFVKTKSEKRNEINDSHVNLLNHEQTHFDIAELFVRKARKEIFEVKKFVSEEEVDSIVNHFLKVEQDYHQLYDDETGFSKNKEAQRKWEKRVKEELEALEKFKHPCVKVRIKNK